MPSREIIVKTNVEELSACAAELFVEIAIDAIRTGGTFSVALAGGSTPRKLYSLLSSDAYRSKLAWSKVQFFLGDERNVPPDSPESNFRMVNETLLTPLDIEQPQIFRWRTELSDPHTAATDYDKILRRHFDRADRSFDLVLLGLGTDGHTASLFPHTPALAEMEKFAVANWVDKLNDYRLTVTFPAINGASSVIFLVSGGDKATAAAEVLEGEFRPDEFPAQLVIPEHGSQHWLLDESAASLLRVW